MSDAFSQLWELYVEHIETVHVEMMDLVRAHPELGELAKRVPSDEFLIELQVFLSVVEDALCRGRWQLYFAEIMRRGEQFAKAGISYNGWNGLICSFKLLLIDQAIEKFGGDARQLSRVLQAETTFFNASLSWVGAYYIAAKQELVEASEIRFRRIVESDILGICEWDEESLITRANDVFLQLVGLERDDLGCGIDWDVIMAPRELDKIKGIFKRLEVEGTVSSQEMCFAHREGWEVPCMFGATGLEPGGGGLGFMLDLSVHKRAKELEEQNDRIAEANRLKSEFLANMSHELRTPLNAIIGFASLMHGGMTGDLSPRHTEFIGDILRSGKYLLRLINDILDLSKVEAGKMEFCPEEIELPDVIQQVASILKELAHKQRVRLELFVDEALATVVMDPIRLKQILYNFLSNAVKFSEHGDVVEIRAVPIDDRFFRLEVEDHGVGIPATQLVLLFSEFQQLHRSTTRPREGTGLGLALTKRIIDAMGGRVGVVSAPGKGSTFYAILPRESFRKSESLDGGVPPMLHPSSDAPRVLVVEDHSGDRHWLVNTLNQAGYAVQSASTGEEAVKLAEVERFDIVTLDIILPGIDGFQALEQIRKSRYNSDVPVIVASLGAEQKLAMAFSVRDVLRKPISADQLLSTLARTQVSLEARPILVVDDDPDCLAFAQAALEAEGIDCLLFDDPVTALAATRSLSPKAVLLDLLMPGLDGFAFLSELRHSTEGKDVPVIVWTVADLSEQDRARLQSQAQAILSKSPFGADSLLKELRALLAQPDL